MVANPSNPHHQYLKTRIETASQPQLLLMLFEAAEKKLNLAKKAIAEKQVEKSHIELTKVQKIFTELMVALDLEKGGDLASELLRIYDFIYHHLVKANIKQDSTLIDEVLPIVQNLREGWTDAVEKYELEVEGKPPKMQTIPNNEDKPLENNEPDESKPKPQYRPYQVTSVSSATQQPKRPRLNIRG